MGSTKYCKGCECAKRQVRKRAAVRRPLGELPVNSTVRVRIPIKRDAIDTHEADMAVFYVVFIYVVIGSVGKSMLMQSGIILARGDFLVG